MALITVMLIFALATILVTAMLRSSYLALRRTANLIDSTQARYYAYGAEELGRQLLRDDAPLAGATGSSDHLGEAWASKDMQFEIDEGKLELNIIDQAGLFNLTELVDAQGRIDAAATARFARLLQAAGLDPGLAMQVGDWQDQDDQTLRGGSEQSAYGVEQVPNQPIADISELQAMQGVEAEVWAKLAPLITALPERSKLNANTAPAPVLLAYAPPTAKAEVERFVQARLLQPAKDATDPVLAQLLGEAASAVDVKSEFFLVRAHAQFRGRHARIDTLVRRDARTGKIRVLGRSDAAKL